MTLSASRRACLRPPFAKLLHSDMLHGDITGIGGYLTNSPLVWPPMASIDHQLFTLIEIIEVIYIIISRCYSAVCKKYSLDIKQYKVAQHLQISHRVAHYQKQENIKIDSGTQRAESFNNFNNQN